MTNQEQSNDYGMAMDGEGYLDIGGGMAYECMDGSAMARFDCALDRMEALAECEDKEEECMDRAFSKPMKMARAAPKKMEESYFENEAIRCTVNQVRA